VPMPRPRDHKYDRQYVRRYKHRWQARPYRDGRRYNLGLFETYEAAWQAVCRFFRQPIPPPGRPKFVFKSPLSDPPRFYGKVRIKLPDGRPVYHRTPVFDTEQAAAAAVEAFLRDQYDRWLADQERVLRERLDRWLTGVRRRH
jgi:hypothetical protein